MKKLFASLICLPLAAALFMLLPANARATEETHDYDNGFCRNCGYYEPAVLNGDVYEISNAGQLYWFVQHVNAGNSTANAILTKNIKVNPGKITSPTSGTIEWVPIDAYNGNFNGNGKTLSGLAACDSITNPERIALFINLNTSAVVENLTLSNTCFSAWGTSGICSTNNGTISNCSVSAILITSAKNADTGGIAEINYGLIENCYFDGDITSGNTIGGIAGANGGRIENCHYSGTLTCSNTISNDMRVRVGGIVGYNYSNSTIENCSNTGYVGGGYYTGGIAGQNDGSIIKCANEQYVGDDAFTVSGTEWVGGIAGYNTWFIENCYNAGSVGGSSNGGAGGICAINQGDISNCYAVGRITSNSNTVGCIAGKNAIGIIENCYYLKGCAIDKSGNFCTGVGSSQDIDGETISKTDAQFASGEVTWLLNGSTAKGALVWFQTCDEGTPSFSGETVYYGYATCSADAQKEYSNSFRSPEKPDHTWQPATCTAPMICTGCSATEGEAKGHNMQESTAAVQPGCETPGSTAIFTCSNGCGKTEGGDPISATGHNYVSSVIDPTCTDQGYTSHTCTNCGDSYANNYIAPNGHSFGNWYVDKEATCVSKGSERRDCENCTYCESKEIAAKGHAWDNGIVTKEPTEDGSGTKVFTCNTCGETRTEVLPPLTHEHNYSKVVTDPTCTERGYTTYICTCGSYVDDYVDALGHNYTTVTTTPTCTKQGYATHTCSRCSNSYVSDYTAAIGHNWDKGVITKEPTENSTGEKLYTCSNCGKTKNDVIPALNHTHSYTETVIPPTCAEQGYTLYKCTCGDEYRKYYEDALGHQYNSDNICTNCGQKDPSATEPAPTEPIPTDPISSDPAPSTPAPTEPAFTTPTAPAQDTDVGISDLIGMLQKSPEIAAILLVAGVAILAGFIGIIAIIIKRR